MKGNFNNSVQITFTTRKIQIKSSQWNKLHNIKAPIIINNINFLSTKTSLHGQCTRQYKHLQEMRSCNFGDDTKEYFSSSQESLGLIIAEGKTGLYITGQSYGPYFTRQNNQKRYYLNHIIYLLSSTAVTPEWYPNTDGRSKCQGHTVTVDAYQLQDHN